MLLSINQSKSLSFADLYNSLKKIKNLFMGNKTLCFLLPEIKKVLLLVALCCSVST